MRTVVSILPQTHKALCLFALSTGMKKTAIADRAVTEYIRANSFVRKPALAQMQKKKKASR